MKNFVAARGMRESAGEESSAGGVAAQTIEAQPASGQIKPKEDAMVRARHDREAGDAWLAVGRSKNSGGAHGQISLGLCRRRLKKRLDPLRTLAPDAAPILCSSTTAARPSASLHEARTRTANADEDHRQEPRSQDRLRTLPTTRRWPR